MPQNLQSNQIQAALTLQVLRNLFIDSGGGSQATIGAGSTVGADDGGAVLQAATDLTLDITVSGVNGLDAGVEAPSTWYYIYLICNPTTGLVQGLLSTSYTTPVLPPGYTQKRLVGAVRNSGASDFLGFRQLDKKVWYLDGLQYLLSMVPGYYSALISVADVVPHPITHAISLEVAQYRTGIVGTQGEMYVGPYVGFYVNMHDFYSDDTPVNEYVSGAADSPINNATGQIWAAIGGATTVFAFGASGYILNL